MKVKIHDTIYDSEKLPIMIILTEKDKLNISHMTNEATRYCCYPDYFDLETIEKWMKEDLTKHD